MLTIIQLLFFNYDFFKNKLHNYIVHGYVSVNKSVTSSEDVYKLHSNYIETTL